MRRLVFPLFVLAVLVCMALPLLGDKASTTSGPGGATSASAPSSQASRPTTAQVMEQARKLAKATEQVIDLFKAGKYDQAKKMLEGMVKEFPDSEMVWYNLACAHSRLGEARQAFKCIDVAIAKGFADFVHLEHDEDFASLRDTPEYARLMARREQVQLDRAHRILDELKQHYGQDFICEIVPKDRLVLATNVDRTTLDDLKARLTEQAEALWNDLFGHKFEQFVTVIIPRTDSADMNGVGGYYANELRLLTAKTVGMTVHHEFTHALHAADQEYLDQAHPIWVLEGLATLFESAEIREGHIIPLPNHRLNYLKTAASQHKTIPWKDMMRYDQANFMRRAAVAYGQARYMMMFLYDKGLLKKWYQVYTETFKADPSGVQAMEEVFDKKLGDIEAQWIDWLGSLATPPVVIGPNHAYIGVRVEPETDGLMIAQLIQNSGADRAGLRARDVIVSIDGRNIIDPGDLIMLVDGHKVGDKLKIRYRRGTEYTTATVELTAMPGGPRRPPARRRPTSTQSAPASLPASIPASRKAA